jgi:putative tryptophan/tyrosine transport system substrate-binding protein
LVGFVLNGQFGMKRRDFIAALGGAAAAWPLAARAQQTVPVIGFLNSGLPGEWTRALEAFRRGLEETGFVEGRNLAIEFRWAEGHYDQLPRLAADLVQRRVAVLVSTGGSTTARVAKAASGTIPLVFTSGGDPVKEGLVASIKRPGGNVTGVTLLTSGLLPKRLEILREVAPKAAVIGVLLNPNGATAPDQLDDVEKAARTLDQRIQILNARSGQEIDAAFAAIREKQIGALIVGADPFFVVRTEQLVALATRHAIPTIYEWREFVEAGGLMSYGSDRSEAYRQVGIYAGRILKDEKPADLPVVRATKIEFVLNLKTARALGLTISLPLLGRADEVIE